MTIEPAEIIDRLEGIKDALAADRDLLRSLLADVEDVLDSADRAYESILCAVDALSELV